MENIKIDELTNILRKLNSGNITEDLRNEAMEIVKDIDPVELSIAEQNLIDEGMNPSDLRHLCDIHMEVLKGELEKIKTSLREGHVVHTMIEEHDRILEFLKELDILNSEIQKLDKNDFDRKYVDKVESLADSILDAENHHQREERVLFKELEKRGITGPTRIMKMEHEDLRAKKRALKELCNCFDYISFSDFKERLDDISKYLVFNLRDHIFKENTILYPSAIESIKEEAVWDKMKVKCDEIGYCSFTFKKI